MVREFSGDAHAEVEGTGRLAAPARPLPALATVEERAQPYIRSLDGLRGVAVIGVLLFHAGHLSGGFLGVDLFFVLSGFLITRVLLPDAVAGRRVRLGHFYARRLRRLAPALLLVVAVVGVASPFLFEPEALSQIRESGIATLFYSANWHALATNNDYWTALSGSNPFEHTWSLAIEEQIYLVWPLVLLLLLRLMSWVRPKVVILFAACTGASVALVSLVANYQPGGDTARVYYGTDTRAFAVMAGAVVAVVASSPRGHAAFASRRMGVASAAAGAGLVLAWITVEGTDSSLYRGLLPLLGVAASVVVGNVAATGATWVSRGLALRPLVYLGTISYGLYLWHWPVYVLLDSDRTGIDGALLTAIRIAVSLALATVSFRLIESPVRFRLGTAPWRVAAPIGVLAACAGLVVGTRDATDLPSADFGESVIAGTAAPADGKPRLLVLGDSQATALAVLAGGPGYDRFQVASATFVGCGIGPGAPLHFGIAVTFSLLGEACDSVLPTWRDAIVDFDPDIVLVHVGAWEVLDRRIGDRDVGFGTQEWDELTALQIQTVTTALTGEDRSVVWLASPCFVPVGESGGPSERGDRARVDRWNELLRGAASAQGASVVPYDEYTCDGPASDGEVEGFAFRPDGVHLTPESAPIVWSWIAAQAPFTDSASRAS